MARAAGEARRARSRGSCGAFPRRRLSALALLFPALAAGCKRAPGGCAQQGSEVTVSLKGLPTTLDWSKSHESSAVNYPVLQAMMRGLTTTSARNEPAPGLAERWDVELRGGRQVYTFHLRPGIVWSDGKTPLTAEDFAFGWRRAMAVGAETAELADIVGVEQVIAARERPGAPEERAARVGAALAGVGVEAVDALTFRVTLRSPRSYFLARVANTYPFFPAPSRDLQGKSEEAVHRYFDEPAGGKPMVVGAFLVTGWDRVAQRVELAQNPFAADRPAQGAVTRLTFLQSELSPVLYAQCRVDLLLMDDPASLAHAPPDTQRSRLLSVYWLGMNTSKLSLPLRQAISHALDRGKLTQGLLPDARAALTFLPPDMPGALSADDPLAAPLPRYDPARARAELAASGYRGEELTLLVKDAATFMPELGIAEAVRVQLAELGVKVRVVPTGNFVNDVKARDGSLRHHLFLRRTGADYPHPQTLFTVFLPDGNHYTDWQKLGGGAPLAEFQALLDAGAAETDPARMRTIFARAEELLLAREAVAVPLYYPDRYYRLRPWLTGLSVDPFNFLTLRDARVKSPAP